MNAAREAWDGRPLFLYGFDELLPTQLDFVESLVRHTDTELTVAVTYEPGRAALAGSATTVELLKPLAREHLTLEPRSEHYAQSARSALHHLERGLFEPAGRRVPPNGAVRLLEAGGERAEAELVGASVLELLRDGMAPEDIAVLVRGGPASELFAQVFDTYGIPVAHERRTPFGETRLGAGLLAFARAARPGGTAQDVVTWLRTPGKLAAAPIAPAEDDQPPRAPDTSPTATRRPHAAPRRRRHERRTSPAPSSRRPRRGESRPARRAGRLRAATSRRPPTLPRRRPRGGDPFAGDDYELPPFDESLAPESASAPAEAFGTPTTSPRRERPPDAGGRHAGSVRRTICRGPASSCGPPSSSRPTSRRRPRSPRAASRPCRPPRTSRTGSRSRCAGPRRARPARRGSTGSASAGGSSASWTRSPTRRRSRPSCSCSSPRPTRSGPRRTCARRTC